MIDEKSKAHAVCASDQLPDLVALEAAGRELLEVMVEGSNKKPSQEAISIAAKMLARRTHRRLRENRTMADDTTMDR